MTQQSNGEKTSCPDCLGIGWIIDHENNRAYPCNCREPIKTAKRFQRAEIPPRFKDCSLENFWDWKGLPSKTAADARKLILDICDSWPDCKKGILFMGPCGTGKTHLAIALLKRLILKGAEGRFLDYQGYLLSLQDCIQKQENEKLYIEPFIFCDVLLLDDIGARRITEFAIDANYYLLNERYLKEKITILTTNYPDEGEVTLADRIGTRMRSRLQEMCQVVILNGEDFRKERK